MTIVWQQTYVINNTHSLNMLLSLTVRARLRHKAVIMLCMQHHVCTNNSVNVGEYYVLIVHCTARCRRNIIWSELISRSPPLKL